MREVMRDSSILSIGMLFAQSLSAVAFAVVARTLGPDLFGPLAAAVGLALLVATVADFGVNTMAVRALAQGDEAMFTETLGAKSAAAISLTAFWVIAAAAAVRSEDLRLAAFVLGLYIGAYLVLSTLTVPLRSERRMVRLAVVQSVEKSATFGCTLFLLAHGFGLVALPLSLVVGTTAAGLLAYVQLRPARRSGLAPRFRRTVAVWTSSFSFGIASLASQAQRADVALVALAAGPAAAGVYAVPARLLAPLGFLPSAFVASIFPRVAARDSSASRPRIVRAGAPLLACMLIVLLLLYLYADRVILASVGEQYAAGVGVLRTYLVGTALAIVNQPAASVLQAEGHESYVARVVAVGAVAGLGGVGLGARLAGAEGAAFGFVLLQLVVFALLVIGMAKAPTEGVTA